MEQRFTDLRMQTIAKCLSQEMELDSDLDSGYMAANLRTLEFFQAGMFTVEEFKAMADFLKHRYHELKNVLE